jgi:hypothetical protein
MKIHYFSRIFFYLSLLSMLFGSACTSQFVNPPKEFDETDLMGTWIANYSEGRIDTIHFQADGTYKQIYENSNINYKFETGWDNWEIEIFPDGRIWLYLQDGRFYKAGERIGELAGQGDPCPTEHPDCIHGNYPRSFYDPYDTQYSTEMVDRLVLAVRATPEGDIILHHMWTTTDRGFAIIGGEKEIFQKLEKK